MFLGVTILKPHLIVARLVPLLGLSCHLVVAEPPISCVTSLSLSLSPSHLHCPFFDSEYLTQLPLESFYLLSFLLLLSFGILLSPTVSWLLVIVVPLPLQD